MRVDAGSAVPALTPATSTEPEHKAIAHPRGSLRIVLVRWHDAWFDIEQPPGGWRDDYVVHTVGYLVRHESGVVSVAQELLPGRDGYRAVTHIPTGVIESITTLFAEDGPGRRAGDRLLRRGV
jgi:hypothetical protein